MYGLAHLAGYLSSQTILLLVTQKMSSDQSINANVRNFTSHSGKPALSASSNAELFYAVRLLLIEAPISIPRIVAPKAQLSE